MHNKYIFLLSLITLLAFGTACGPDNKKVYNEEDIKTIKALPETHISFIAEFYPNVVRANNHILKQRKRLLKYRDDFPNAIKRDKKLNRLNKIAGKYRLTDSLFRKGLTKSEYLSRMDKLLSRELKVNVKKARDPMTCVVRGCGKVLDDLDLLQKVRAS